MVNEPTVSIIIPIYNVENYLRRCLDSILNQSFKDIEIICIDDCSTDNSLQIIKEYAKNDNRFVIIEQKTNQGQGIARNIGIDTAKGKYISFVDPDDYIETNMYQILIEKFEQNKDIDIIQFDYYKDYEKTKKSKYISISNNIKASMGIVLKDNTIINFQTLPNLKFNCFPQSVWNKVYLAKLIKENNIKFSANKHGEDIIFTVKSLFLSKKILYIESGFYHYLIRRGSAMNNTEKGHFCVFNNVKEIENFLKENDLFEKFESSFKDYVVNRLQIHFKCINKDDIKNYLKECSKYLSEEDYKIFLRGNTRNYKFIEKIFSIKNGKKFGKECKVVKILGFDIRIPIV